MTASDGRFASCHSFRIFLFSRGRPNWSLSAACRKDTIGERIPLLPDYKSLIRRYYSELWNAWRTTALEELIGEGYRSVARLTYTGTHRGELFGFSGTEKKITYQSRK